MTMKKHLALLAVSGALASSPLLAASFTIPMAFEYIALDGQRVDTSLIMHTAELNLAPGYHEIAIRYSDMVEGELSDTPEAVKSAAFIVTLEVAEDDYYLRPAGGKPIRDPRRYASAPQVEITRGAGGEVAYHITQTNISRDFAGKLYARGATGALNPAVAAPAAALAAADPEPDPALSSAPVTAAAARAEPPPAADPAAASEMLRLWWQRADEQTRKDFLSWAIEQL